MTKAVASSKSHRSNNPGERHPLEKSKRSAIRRWLIILGSLRDETPPPFYEGAPADWIPNANQFAKALECNPRTIQRDIEEMRLCGYNIEYDRQEHCLNWSNKDGVETLPLMTATEEEVIALLTALSISHSVLDVATAKHLKTFLGKLEQHIQGGFLHPLEVIEQITQFKHVWNSPQDTSIWTSLQRAILDQRGIQLEYATPYAGTSPRTLRLLPLMLANLEGVWYLYAIKHSPKDGTDQPEIHLYRLNRMSRVRFRRFEVPEDWDRERILSQIEKGVGPWQGGPEEEVSLRIDGSKVGFMRERAWNPGHTWKRQKDGSWILRFTSSQVEHLVPFILQWAPDIEVLGPNHLREAVKRTAELAAELHHGPGA